MARPPPPALPDRMSFEAPLHIARTGVQLRELPEELGRWDVVHNRFRRRVASVAPARPLQATTADPQSGEVRRVLVDSTNVHARRHAAGAVRKAKRFGPGRAGRRGVRGWGAAAAGGPARSS